MPLFSEREVVIEEFIKLCTNKNITKKELAKEVKKLKSIEANIINGCDIKDQLNYLLSIYSIELLKEILEMRLWF